MCRFSEWHFPMESCGKQFKTQKGFSYCERNKEHLGPCSFLGASLPGMGGVIAERNHISEHEAKKEKDKEDGEENLQPDPDLEEKLEDKTDQERLPSVSELMIEFLSDLVASDQYNLSDVITQLESDVLSKDSWESFQGALSQAIDDKKSDMTEEPKLDEGDEELMVPPTDGKVSETPESGHNRQVMKYRSNMDDDMSYMNNSMTKPLINRTMQSALRRKLKAAVAEFQRTAASDSASLNEIINLYKQLGLEPEYLNELRKAMLTQQAELDKARAEVVKTTAELQGIYKTRRASQLIAEMKEKGLIEGKDERDLMTNMIKMSDEEFYRQVKLVAGIKVQARREINTPGREIIAAQLREGATPVIMESEVKLATNEREELVETMVYADSSLPSNEELREMSRKRDK